MAEKNKPIFKNKSGAIAGSIWANVVKKDGKEFTFNTITLSRSYTKDEGKTWIQEDINFRPNDLIKIQTVLNQIQNQLFLKDKVEE